MKRAADEEGRGFQNQNTHDPLHPRSSSSTALFIRGPLHPRPSSSVVLFIPVEWWLSINSQERDS